MKITPIDEPGGSRIGSLTGVSFKDVEKVLGFKANCEDDPDKVTHSWGFSVNMKDVDGTQGVVNCGIWDYKGSRILSTDGPDAVFVKLFGDKYSNP
jgi:hypothetical protein